MGYRNEVFDRLRDAIALDTPDRDLEQLREEASTCLGDFVGLEPTIWDDLPAPLAGQKKTTNWQVPLIAVSPNGKLVAFALQDGTIRIRDVATGLETATLSGNAGWIVFGRDSRTLFGDVGKELIMWKAGADERWDLARSRKLDNGRREVCMGADHYLVLSGGEKENRIEAFAWNDDEPLGRVILDQNTHVDNIYATRGPSRLFAVGSKEGKACLFLGNLEPGKLDAIPWKPAIAGLGSVLSWNGRYLAGVSDNGISLYDLERRQHLPFIRSKGNWHSASFSRDGRYLLIAAQSGTIHFWSLASNREAARLSMPGGSMMPAAMQLSRDDQILAAGRAGGGSIWPRSVAIGPIRPEATDRCR